jgi:hypothetical protein
MGSGMEESGVVTAWEPRGRFAYEEDWQPFEEAAAERLATEWLVEARSGGTCVVRVVCSIFASGADWDRELGNMRDGWAVYLQNLRLYLTHFPGQRCSWIMVTGNAPGPKDDAWAALTGALGLQGASEGGRAAATARAGVALEGIVEHVGESEHHRELSLRLDEPAPGVALVFVYVYRDQVYTSVHAYLFGDEAPAVVARDEPAWRAWMEERFPSQEPAAEAGAATS